VGRSGVGTSDAFAGAVGAGQLAVRGRRQQFYVSSSRVCSATQRGNSSLCTLLLAGVGFIHAWCVIVVVDCWREQPCATLLYCAAHSVAWCFRSLLSSEQLALLLNSDY
jgi:hypothetical protein